MIFGTGGKLWPIELQSCSQVLRKGFAPWPIDFVRWDGGGPRHDVPKALHYGSGLEPKNYGTETNLQIYASVYYLIK